MTSPERTAAETLLAALEKRSRKYFEQLRLCKQAFSEEAVHDLRVSIRRLLALVDLLKQCAPHPRLKKLRRELKDQLDQFDDLRDTQVMLAEISENLQTLPELASLQSPLQKREKRLLRRAAKNISGIQTGAITRRLAKIAASLQEPSDTGALTTSLLQALDDAYATVIQRHGWASPGQPASIHRVRIAFKKFRYMIEIIHPTLPGYPASLLERLHDYQGLMGEFKTRKCSCKRFSKWKKPKGQAPPRLPAAMQKTATPRQLTPIWKAATK